MQRTETCTRLVPWDTCSHMTGCRGVADDTNNATRRAKSHSMSQNLPRWVLLRVLVYDRCTSQQNVLRVAAAISAGKPIEGLSLEGERSWLLGSRSPQDMQRESGTGTAASSDDDVATSTTTTASYWIADSAPTVQRPSTHDIQ